MQSKIVSQLASSVSFKLIDGEDDSVNIQKALNSSNHVQILMGFTALRDYIKQVAENRTSAVETNK